MSRIAGCCPDGVYALAMPYGYIRGLYTECQIDYDRFAIELFVHQNERK
jgi:hypothetical protein